MGVKAIDTVQKNMALFGAVCFICGFALAMFLGRNGLQRISGELNQALDANRTVRQELSGSRATVEQLLTELGESKTHYQRAERLNMQLAERNRLLERENESIRKSIGVSLGAIAKGRGSLKEARGIVIKLQKDGRKKD
jgi:hypothetical protein